MVLVCLDNIKYILSFSSQENFQLSCIGVRGNRNGGDLGLDNEEFSCNQKQNLREKIEKYS